MEERSTAQLRRLGKTLRAVRLELQLSQETLAEEAEIHRTYVSQIEAGTVNLSWDTLSRLAQALRLKPSALLLRAGL